MGKTRGGGRDWLQIYSIYGGTAGDDRHTVCFLLIHSFLFAALSIAILIYFPSVLSYLHSSVPLARRAPFDLLRFALGFTGSVLALSSACLMYAAGNILYSSLPLQFHVAHRIVAAIPDWSAVRTALDVNCGRGILLNSVAAQMKKQGSSGSIVGLDRTKETSIKVLRRARIEGTQEYVTCREGDAKELPFGDGVFDVVVTAGGLRGLGEERGRGLGEMVRVLREGGVGVLWDLRVVPEFVERLREMRMEEIRVSERIMAYMASSWIVSFRKPTTTATAMPAAAAMDVVDWRTNIC